MIPNPGKIEALKNLPKSKNENLLQSFLGIVNYLSHFDPQIANLTHKLKVIVKEKQ